MAASMAAMSVTDMVASPLGQIEIEPNDLVDKLIPEIIYAATSKWEEKIIGVQFRIFPYFPPWHLKPNSNLYRIFAANFCHYRTWKFREFL